MPKWIDSGSVRASWSSPVPNLQQIPKGHMTNPFFIQAVASDESAVYLTEGQLMTQEAFADGSVENEFPCDQFIALEVRGEHQAVVRYEWCMYLNPGSIQSAGFEEVQVLGYYSLDSDRALRDANAWADDLGMPMWRLCHA